MTLTDEAPADCAEMLVQGGADIHTPVNNSTLLHLSAEGGNASLVTLFLKAGASPTEKDAQGRSPLDYAFIHCTAPRPARQEVIGILLDAAPELKKELAAMKRRFCINLVLLAFCVLFLSECSGDCSPDKEYHLQRRFLYCIQARGTIPALHACTSNSFVLHKMHFLQNKTLCLAFMQNKHACLA